MPRFKSILSRIVILHVVAVVITSILMSVGLSWLLSYATNNIHNKAMQEQANAVAEHLSIGPDGRLQLNLPSDLLGLYSPEYGRYAYAVVDDSGAVLFSSAKDHTALFPADLRSGEVEFLQHRRGSATVSGASVRKTIGDRTVWVQAGEDLANRDVLTDDIVADFYRDVGWITLPILLVLLITDIAIFRRALRPLRQASDIAAKIGPARPGLRLPTDEIPREVRPLVSAVNLGLDRLEEGFKIQRDFTADAAHELRTPLSILRTRIDVLEDTEIRQALRHNVEGMAHIVGQLLDIAELDAVAIDPSETADLQSVAAEVAEFVAPLALAQGKDIALSGATEPVWGKSGNAEPRYPQPRGKRHQPHRTRLDGRICRGGQRQGERSRSRPRHSRPRAQADLPPLLAARPSQGRQHRTWPVDRAAYRRIAFGNHHGGEPPERSLLFTEIRAPEIGRSSSAVLDPG